MVLRLTFGMTPGCWNKGLISSLVDEDQAQRILSIPIVESSKEDLLV